jgi:tetratricopeptide (TPR) repeat protein
MAALALLDQAIARDPLYAPALAWAAWCRHLIDTNGWTDDALANQREGVRLAKRALQLAADDPVVLGYAGFVLGYFGEDIDAALRLTERALALNPSHAIGWMRSGWLNLFAGRTETAIEHFETSLRLDPRGRRNVQLFGIGLAHFFARRFEKALEKILLTLEELPSHTDSYRFLAACYAHLGQLRDARKTVERLRELAPGTLNGATRYAMIFRNPEHRELFLSGLHLALGEET